MTQILEEADLEVPASATDVDLTEVQTLVEQWLTVIDAVDQQERARRLNELLSTHASYPA